MIFPLIKPILFTLPPEAAHGASLWALRAGLAGLAAGPRVTDPRLHVSTWGETFRNPLGLAAGYDKHVEAPMALSDLGFGFIEVGGVTPLPQPGNPKPRVFRLTEDRAVINRFGLNSEGADVAAARLAKFNHVRGERKIGVNLGKNKESKSAEADYAAVAKACAPYVDFLTINVSSPNTPGLRALQSEQTLRDIVAAVRDAAALAPKPPAVLVKIAPDLTNEDVSGIVAVARDGLVDGLIISNTTIARPDTLKGSHKAEQGGLSGAPLFAPSTKLLGDIYRATGGTVPLIGVGGIENAETAYAKIKAGASLLQLYTGLIYHGPALISEILTGVLERLTKDGFSSVTEAIGADHPKES